MKEITLAVTCASSGNTITLFGRIRKHNSPFIVQVDDNNFIWKRNKEEEGNKPKWALLGGVASKPVPGINMTTGAQEGFVGPTNKENAIGPPKLDYLVHECEKSSALPSSLKIRRRTCLLLLPPMLRHLLPMTRLPQREPN